MKANIQLGIDQQEREDLVYGLQMRICVIETGTPTLRAADAVNMGQHKIVKALSADQRALIARHEALIKKLLSASTVR